MIHFLEMTSGAVDRSSIAATPKAALARLDAGLPRFRASVLSKMPWVMAEFQRYYVAAATMLGKVALAP